MPQMFFYISEIAALLGWSKQWTGTKLRRGEIPGERIGKGRWRVRQVVLKEFARTHDISLDWDALHQLQEQRKSSREAASAAHRAALEKPKDADPPLLH